MRFTATRHGLIEVRDLYLLYKHALPGRPKSNIFPFFLFHKSNNGFCYCALLLCENFSFLNLV